MQSDAALIVTVVFSSNKERKWVSWLVMTEIQRMKMYPFQQRVKRILLATSAAATDSPGAS